MAYEDHRVPGELSSRVFVGVGTSHLDPEEDQKESNLRPASFAARVGATACLTEVCLTARAPRFNRVLHGILTRKFAAVRASGRRIACMRHAIWRQRRFRRRSSDCLVL